MDLSLCLPEHLIPLPRCHPSKSELPFSTFPNSFFDKQGACIVQKRGWTQPQEDTCKDCNMLDRFIRSAQNLKYLASRDS